LSPLSWPLLLGLLFWVLYHGHFYWVYCFESFIMGTFIGVYCFESCIMATSSKSFTYYIFTYTYFLFTCLESCTTLLVSSDVSPHIDINILTCSFDDWLDCESCRIKVLFLS
jgi:multisubunit Na+/H+ antiporter MnhE subunit